MNEPRSSKYLQYLPAIFQGRPPLDGTHVHLGEFLVPFEENLAALESVLASEDQFFSPPYAPAEDFLPWLATWVALVLDEEWDEDKRRRLLSEAMELYRWRGTVRGMKRYLEIYTGLRADDIDIREGRWPGGMQLDVASRIAFKTGEQPGGDTGPLPQRREAFHKRPPPGAREPYITRRNSLVDYLDGSQALPQSNDYYVVDTVDPLDPNTAHGGAAAQTAQAEQIQVIYNAAAVDKIEFEPDGVRFRYWQNPSRVPSGRHIVGGTLLVSEVERPFCFIVELRGLDSLADRRREAMIGKVRAILDAEKPAHTQYYLAIKPLEPVSRPSMQIGVWSSIGLDTVISHGLVRRSS